MRKFNRLLSAAVAVIMLGSSFSGSVSAMGAENIGTVGTSAANEAADSGWTANAETATEEEPETETEAYEEAPPVDTERSDKELSEVRKDTDSADAEQNENIIPESKEKPLTDQEAETPETEDVAEEKASDLDVPETKDTTRTGNIYFIIDGEGGALDINSADGNALLSAWTGEDSLSITDLYGDTAKVTADGVTVSDSDKNSIYTGDSLMLDAEDFFAVEQDDAVYIIENGKLREASDEEKESLTASYVSYADGTAEICLTGEENTSVSYAVRAKDGFENSTYEVPSNTELSENEDVLYGTAVFASTSADSSNTYRFSFNAAEETEEMASDKEPDVKEQNAADKEISVQTEEEIITKEAASAVLQNGYDFSVTYNANGGTFDGGSDKNVVVYYVPDRYISKTDNVSDDGEKTGPYAANLAETDIVRIEGAEKLYVTITYQTDYSDWVCIYGAGITPNTYNYYSSISNRLYGTEKTTKTYEIDGDTAQFFFKSNGRDKDYLGYYAEVSDTPLLEHRSGKYKIPKYNNKRLVSWNTSPDGDGSFIDPSSDVLRTDTVLYAQYDNAKEAVWFEDGTMIIKNTADPIDQYIAEHGKIIKRAPFVNLHINGSYSMDSFVYDRKIEEFAAIQDEEGKYVVFGDDGNMTGLSNEPTYYRLCDIENTYIAKGNYVLSFRDENKKYPDRHRIESNRMSGNIPKEEAIYYESNRMIYDPNIVADQEENIHEVKEIYTRPDLHCFYIDNVEKSSKQPHYFRFPYDGADTVEYMYTKTEENGDLVYTFDPENGTERWITVEANRRTIVRDVPHSGFGIRHLIPEEGWTRKLGYSEANLAYGEERNGIDYSDSNDSWSYNCSPLGANIEEVFSVKEYHKCGIGKSTVNADFCLLTDWISDWADSSNTSKRYRYVLEHYDTYEYAGKTYKNVYIPKKELKPWNSTDEDTIIHTVNGDFTVFYPNYTYGGTEWFIKDTRSASRIEGNVNFYLTEIKAENGYYAETLTADQTNLSSFGGSVNIKSYLELYNKKTGEKMYGTIGNQYEASKLGADDIGIRFTNGASYDSIDSLSAEIYKGTKTILNDAYPKIKKTVSNDYISSDQPFTFEIMTYDGSMKNLGTVTLKNGEEMLLTPETVKGLTDRNAATGNIYVKEIDKEGWESQMVTRVGVEEYTYNGYKDTYKFYPYQAYRYYGTPPLMEFTNTRKTNTLTLRKSVKDGAKAYSHRFKLTLWDEENGNKYPFNGYEFHVDSLPVKDYKTNENGEVFMDIPTSGSDVTEVSIQVPDCCHYKVEEISSTLAAGVPEKTNDTGIVKGDSVVSTWINEVHSYDIVISKTDVGGHEIAGAQMKITGREEGASADITPITWTSVEGQDKIIQLYPGTYTLHEEAAPESGLYAKASDITFTVDKDGKVKVDGKDVSKVTMVDEYNVSSLKVKKTVEGSLGSKDKQFNFTMTLKNPDGTPYTKAVSYKKGTDTGTLTPSAEGKVTFTLSHGDETEFTDLVVGTKYAVEEADYSSEGYMVTKQNNTGTVAVQNPDVSFVNSREAAVPTGTDIPVSGALALVVAACVGLAAFVVRRRLMI